MPSSFSDQRSAPVGELNVAGIELEALVRTRRFEAGLSHSYTRMVSFDSCPDGFSP